MTPAEVAPSLPRLAFPLVISFTLRFLFGIVDLVYAAQLDDPVAAVASISLYIPFQGFYIAVWVGLSAGFTAALSNAFGRRDETRIVQLKRTMLRMQCFVAPGMACVGVAVWFLVPHLGLDPDLAQAFRVYGTTMLIGLPLTGFWSIYPDSVIKAHYDTRSTMLAGMYATATNITLNTLFVFVFEFGLFGIALATVLSRLVALAYAMHRSRVLEAARFANPEWQKPLPLPQPAGQRSPLPAILVLSVPAGAAYALTAAESSLVNALLAALPDSKAAIASFGIYHNLTMLALMPTIGVSVAVLPYVARLVPEGRLQHVAADLRRTMLLAAGLVLLFAVPAGWIFAADVASYFVSGDDADAILAAASPATLELLRLLPFGALAALPFLMLRPVFEALQQPRIGLLLTFVRFVVFSYPLLLLGRYLGPEFGFSPLFGIAAGLAFASLCASILTVLRVRRALAAIAAP